MEEMLSKSNGRRTIPQIFFDDHHVGGYQELRVLEKSGKLKELIILHPIRPFSNHEGRRTSREIAALNNNFITQVQHIFSKPLMSIRDRPHRILLLARILQSWLADTHSLHITRSPRSLCGSRSVERISSWRTSHLVELGNIPNPIVTKFRWVCRFATFRGRGRFRRRRRRAVSITTLARVFS